MQTAVSSAEWADWGFAFTPAGFGCGEGLLMLGCLGVYSLLVSLWLENAFFLRKNRKGKKVLLVLGNSGTTLTMLTKLADSFNLTMFVSVADGFARKESKEPKSDIDTKSN